jgi:hypothetical protein
VASVFRTTAVWQNFIGAPGYTKFSFIEVTGDAGAVAATTAMRTFFNALLAFIPIGATVQVQPEVQEYDEVTGTLLSEIVASSTPAIVTGTAAGSYAGGSGMFIGWKTGTIWQGRRVQGRSFIVPAAGVFEANGTLTSATIAAVTSAGMSLINDPASTFAVWAKRMSAPTTPPTKPTQIDGAAFQVLSVSVKDQASQLRSRRN